MLKVLSNILCDLDPKVKVIGQKAGICDGVPSTSALVIVVVILGINTLEQNMVYKVVERLHQNQRQFRYHQISSKVTHIFYSVGYDTEYCFRYHDWLLCTLSQGELRGQAHVIWGTYRIVEHKYVQMHHTHQSLRISYS